MAKTGVVIAKCLVFIFFEVYPTDVLLQLATQLYCQCDNKRNFVKNCAASVFNFA